MFVTSIDLEKKNKTGKGERGRAQLSHIHICILLGNLSERNELLRGRYEYNALVSKRARTAHLRDSAVHFGDSNRAGKSLARYLQTRTQRARITNMTHSRGRNVTGDDETLDVLHTYYQNLYSSEVDPSQVSLDAFFDGLPLPSLLPLYRALLDSPIKLSEILEVIISLSSGMALGPDGLSA